MPSPGVAAVDRASTILAAFEGEPTPLAKLARRTGLYKSTLLRLMASLQDFGYLVQLFDGRYHLGPTPFRLGAVYQRANNLHDHLRQLVAASRKRIVPCQARRQAAALFPVDSQHSTLDRVEAEMLLPLDRGAAGRVILAFDGERSETFDRICENCIATSFGERDPDCAGMAWALFEPNRKPAGAVALRTRAAFQQGEYQDHVFAVAEGGCSDAITWGPAELMDALPTPSPIEGHAAEMRPSLGIRK